MSKITGGVFQSRQGRAVAGHAGRGLTTCGKFNGGHRANLERLLIETRVGCKCPM